MSQSLHVYPWMIVIWMMVGGSVNVKVGGKVVRDKEGLHQIRGEHQRQGRGDQREEILGYDSGPCTAPDTNTAEIM